MKFSHILFSVIFALSLMTSVSSSAGTEGHKKAARYMKSLPKKTARTPASIKNSKKAKRTPAASKKAKSKKAKGKKLSKKIKPKRKKSYGA